MSVDIRLAKDYFLQEKDADVQELPNLVTPGEKLSFERYLRGHGTFEDSSGQLTASVAGQICLVGQLVTAIPVKSRYTGVVGDLIVGRITEVQQKRWKVDTNSRLESALNLANVNLMGGELRRRSEADKLAMRSFLKEGDLISAEVQSVQQDGVLILHTRSLRYGKLSQGVLVKISPYLIKSSKLNFHNLPCGASVIIGNNGYVFVGPTVNEDESSGGFVQNLEPVSLPERQVIVRLRNCIQLLSQSRIPIYDTSIMSCYEVSVNLGYSIKDLLLPEVVRELAALVRQQVDDDVMVT